MFDLNVARKKVQKIVTLFEKQIVLSEHTLRYEMIYNFF